MRPEKIVAKSIIPILQALVVVSRAQQGFSGWRRDHLDGLGTGVESEVHAARRACWGRLHVHRNQSGVRIVPVRVMQMLVEEVHLTCTHLETASEEAHELSK